jgi:hypothetical protein
VDVSLLAATLANRRPRLAAVEAVHAFPGQGVTGMFHFGASWGLVRGVLAGLSVPTLLVTPQRWQRAVLGILAPGTSKLVALQFARARWPACSWLAGPRCRRPHDGMVDAACLAVWALSQDTSPADYLA